MIVGCRGWIGGDIESRVGEGGNVEEGEDSGALLGFIEEIRGIIGQRVGCIGREYKEGNRVDRNNKWFERIIVVVGEEKGRDVGG